VERGTLAPDQKKAVAEGRTLVFVDQSGFYLLPGKVRTYPPVGQTPVIRAPLSRDHLSAMGGITPEGKLYLRVQERAYRGQDVVRFLQHLLGHIPGKLLVIWDGAPIHRSQAVKDYLSRGAAQRIHLEQFPSYAPELNPAEGIWSYLKRVELKNLCCQSISHLNYELHKAKERLRHKTNVILGCIRQPGFY
jgi:transposase